MKFLCLHGMGTNSQILESQFEAIRARLPPVWDFEFLDGENSTKPFADIGDAYPGPYLCYYADPTPAAVQSAVDTVLDVINTEGPYDAVLGFSNGAALAATVLAAAAERNPRDSPPFRAAVFFCSITPYRLDSGPLHLTFEGDTVVSASRGDVPAQKDEPYDLQKDPEAAGIVAELQGRKDIGWEVQPHWSKDFLLGYYPPLHGQRIHIPTVHVIGDEDRSYKEQGKRLVELCNPRAQCVISHPGGHQFPRDAPTIAKVARAIEDMVNRAGLQVA